MTLSLWPAVLVALFALSGWLVALAVFGCYRAMRAIVNERAVEIRQLRATHDERLQQLRAEREARVMSSSNGWSCRPRPLGRPARYGDVSRW